MGEMFPFYRRHHERFEEQTSPEGLRLEWECGMAAIKAAGYEIGRLTRQNPVSGHQTALGKSKDPPQAARIAKTMKQTNLIAQGPAAEKNLWGGGGPLLQRPFRPVWQRLRVLASPRPRLTWKAQRTLPVHCATTVLRSHVGKLMGVFLFKPGAKAFPPHRLASKTALACRPAGLSGESANACSR
jgi:hypothetical protein